MTDEQARFWAKVTKTDSGCWSWQTPPTARNYPSFWMESGKRVGAHRVAWMFTNGEIPRGMWVLHRCDNTGCVRPDHLFLGTAADNSRDMVDKGRGKAPVLRGEKHGMAVLTADQVIWARSAVGDGRSQRSVASELGVSPSTIHLIVRGHKWRHLL